MQSRYLIRLLCHQVHTENIGKKMVIAIPVTLVIQRNEKEVTSLQAPPNARCYLDVLMTASHSEPFKRSRMEVWSRKLRTSSGWRCKTSSIK